MDQGIAVNKDLDEYLQCANLFERRLHSYKLKARAFQTNSDYSRGSVNETAVETLKRADDLAGDDHHPTTDLEQNMRADGRPKPSDQYTAHHIVPGKGRTKDNYETRIRMHTLGVAINDGNNGAWMIQKTDYKPHWFAGDAAAHKCHHTLAYEDWLNSKISLTKTENSLRSFLRITGSQMENGDLQPENYRR
jgi:hypothetical protein